MEHPGAPPSRENPMSNYQFSSEEIRVLRECNTESFFQRSLPLGIGLGVGAYFGVQNGYLKPNLKYGAVPKVVVSVIIGYFMGKFSYQQKCAEKIMRLPNSQLGELLRQRRQGGVMERLAPDQNLGVGMALAPFTPSGADVYSDEHLQDRNYSGSLNLDTESRPTLSGLDEIYRPTLDNPSPFGSEPELPIEPKKPGTTYEDLRKQNREEYLKNQSNRLNSPLPPEAPAVIRQREPSNEAPTGKTNKYGDTWTN